MATPRAKPAARRPATMQHDVARALEQRLQARLRAYAEDVPEYAFPTFLEALLYESLDAPELVAAPPRP